MSRPILIAVITCLFIYLVSPPGHSQCTDTAIVTKAIQLYDRAPSFSTGSGWRLGAVIITIKAQTRVQICEERTIGTMFDRRKWYYIQFRDRHGWVPSYGIELTSAISPMGYPDKGLTNLPFLSPATAYALESNTGLLPEESLILPQSTALILYIMAFVCGVMGMLAKVVFDEIDRGKVEDFSSLVSCVNYSKCIKAFVVSPIIFIGFLKTGDFSTTNSIAAMLIYVCTAFQNGFFWQSVIPGGSSKRTSEKPGLVHDNLAY